MDFRKVPNISVDCVILGFNNVNIDVLLSRRKLHMHDEKYPVIDDWILCGNQIFKSEKLDESAKRIYKELSGQDDAFKKQFRTFGNPSRIKTDKDLLWVKSQDTHPRTMSVAYYFLIPSDKITLKSANTQWFSLNELPQLGFDHKEIIECASADLKQKVMIEPLIFELLHDKFTLNELQVVYESTLDIEIDNRNFRKKAKCKPYIVPLDEKRTGSSKKPSSLFMFSRDVYNRTSNQNHIINI